jgi:hypothetical protein
MKKRIRKIVKLNLKNAIVIRTNLKPFEINKGSIVEMKKVLDAKNVPEINKTCEKCMFLETGKGLI